MKDGILEIPKLLMKSEFNTWWSKEVYGTEHFVDAAKWIRDGTLLESVIWINMVNSAIIREILYGIFQLISWKWWWCQFGKLKSRISIRCWCYGVCLSLRLTVGNMKSAALNERNYQFITILLWKQNSILAPTKAFYIVCYVVYFLLYNGDKFDGLSLS